MEDNPFSMIVNKIREDNRTQIPASYRIGKVVTTIPLSVDVSGILLDGDELLKNYELKNLEIDDSLLLIPIEDEQRYIILCKVVDL